jgi:hypothetical protein
VYAISTRVPASNPYAYGIQHTTQSQDSSYSSSSLLHGSCEGIFKLNQRGTGTSKTIGSIFFGIKLLFKP